MNQRKSVLLCASHILALLLVFFKSGAAMAQPFIIPVETLNNALVLNVNERNDLEMIWYGEKLSDISSYSMISGEYRQPGDYTEVLNSAYTASGSRNLAEPAVTVRHADGNYSLDLKYVRHSLTRINDNVSLLEIVLKDPVYDFQVTLCYRSFFKEDVIEQWSIIRHHEKGKVTLIKFASANLYLKSESFWLHQFHGDWAKEMQPEETRLTHGIKTLDSKLGTRADLFQPPVFMVSFGAPATEETGQILLGALEWSGNFRFDLEVDMLNNLRIIAGINNYASSYELKQDEDFTTPAFLTVYSASGKGDASRKLHSWARNYKIADGKGTRLTLLNNWESTYFDFNEDKLSSLMRDTKKLGADLFLLDDGWFGNKYPRNDDKAGLGDWQANKSKLPHGIGWLVKEADKNGIKFGIWLEPEMVNPKSELYENHRDWVIRQPDRDEYYFRNQLVLDLGNPDVQNFVFQTVDGLLSKYPGLAYIKWDCNAVIYNAFSSNLENQSHLYIDYVKGLYKVLDRIRNKYPAIPLMLCSGGGGRVDYGALQYFTEYWPSDNTDPLERIYMQWEYSYFYPAISSCNHVTDWGKQPLKFRVDVAMMGKLGFDIVVDKLNPNDLVFCQDALITYNSFKNLIYQGDQFRLSDPYLSDIASMLYMNGEKSQGVCFSYLVSSRYDAGSKTPVRLKGLNRDKKYAVKEINMYPGTTSNFGEGTVYTGEFLMKIGLNPGLNNWKTSAILKIEEVK